MITGLATAMASRTPVILDVIRDRNSLYRQLPENYVENIYTIKIINQSNDARAYSLSISGMQGAVLDGVGDSVQVEGGGIVSLPVRVKARREDAHGVNTILFSVGALDDASVVIEEDSRFIGPMP